MFCAVEFEGGAGFFVVDVAHELDDGVFVMPVAAAGGVDGVVGDFDAEEVGQGLRPGEGTLASALDDRLDFGFGGRRDGVGWAGDDELAVGGGGAAVSCWSAARSCRFADRGEGRIGRGGSGDGAFHGKCSSAGGSLSVLGEDGFDLVVAGREDVALDGAEVGNGGAGRRRFCRG